MNQDARDKYLTALQTHNSQPQTPSIDWGVAGFLIVAIGLSLSVVWWLTMCAAALVQWIVARWFA